MNGTAKERYGGAALASKVSDERGVRYNGKQKDMCGQASRDRSDQRPSCFLAGPWAGRRSSLQS